MQVVSRTELSAKDLLRAISLGRLLEDGHVLHIKTSAKLVPPVGWLRQQPSVGQAVDSQGHQTRISWIS